VSTGKFDEIEVRRVPSGFRNARVREAQALPLGWRHLTAVDIGQIRTIVAATAMTTADLAELEACLLLWCALVTGRHPLDLLTMTVRIVGKGARLGDQPQGLIGRQGKWGWWLVAAGPRDQKNTLPGMNPTSRFLYLPATKIVAALAERCVAMRRGTSGGRVHVSGEPQPLFSTGPRLIGMVAAILAARNPVGPDRSRRATTTPEAVARWLQAELVGAPGGDVVPASVITGRVPAVGRTAVHYGSISHRSVVRRYEAAIRSVDALSHDDPPGSLVTSYLGDKLTPTDDAVRRMIDGLADAAAAADSDAGERHRAVMRYTVALLSFALAHRSYSGSMPSRRGVHNETGFCWIRDKVIGGGQSRRLVWVCALAEEQLRLYDAHLDQLQSLVSSAAAGAIAEIRAGNTLPTFDLTDDGRVMPLSISAAIGGALKPWGLPKNAGRHWLRAQLVGRCSTETLHALYGHGPVSDGSWDADSTLDPVVYRADLARVLDPTLTSIGWAPMTGPPSAIA
jgi:hypothetical protein